MPGMAAPGAASSAITVAASNISGDVIAPFSSMGKRDDDQDNDSFDELKPEITAPGVLINSAERGTGNGEVACSGTSMAAAHVSGVAALLIQKYKALGQQITPGSLKEILMVTADDRGDTGWDPLWGNGLINANEALNVMPISNVGFPSHPSMPAWNSMDLRIANPISFVSGSDNQINAEITNLGPGEFVEGVKVRFGIYNPSLRADLQYYELGVVQAEPIFIEETVTVDLPWTPESAWQTPNDPNFLFMAEIIYPYDSDFGDNFAQKREIYAESNSPANFEFLVYSPAFLKNSANVRVRVSHDSMGLPDSSGLNNWTYDFFPKRFILSKDTCPETIFVTLTPPSGVLQCAGAYLDLEAYAIVNNKEIFLNGIRAAAYHDTTSNDPTKCPVNIEEPLGSKFALSFFPPYPNPSVSELVIPFEINKAHHLEIQVIDPFGRIAFSYLTKVLQSGFHSITWDHRGVSPGIYFVRLKSRYGILNRKVIITE